jgi:hypothetical protein
LFVLVPSAFRRFEADMTAVAFGIMALVLFAVRRLLRVMMRREAIVGTDGVVVEGYGTRRHIPYPRVVEVVRDARGVVLVLHGGQRVLLPTLTDSREPLPTGEDPHPTQPRGDVVTRDALLARIQEAMGSAYATTARQTQLAQLDRHGEDVAVWRERLRVLAGAGAEGGGYRGLTIDGDTLVDIVGDAGVAPERRVAAAVALACVGDERAWSGVRIAVDACADEDLRAALEQASEGEIDDRALRRLEVRSRSSR